MPSPTMPMRRSMMPLDWGRYGVELRCTICDVAAAAFSSLALSEPKNCHAVAPPNFFDGGERARRALGPRREDVADVRAHVEHHQAVPIVVDRQAHVARGHVVR